MAKFLFNPFTGNLDITGEAGESVAGSYNLDKFTLTSTNITNKYVVLTEVPTTNSKVMLFIIGAPSTEDYGTAFVMTLDDGGKRLSWSGLSLDGLLESDDKLVVLFD